MKPVRTQKAAVVLVSGFVLLGLAGCAAGGRSPRTPPSAEVAGASAGAEPVEAPGAGPGASPAASQAEGNAPPATDGSPAEIEPGEAADPNPAASAAGNAAEAVAETKTGRGRKKGVGRSICRQKGGVDEELIDEAHRKLYETLCGAALWFDGLFGERNEATIASARGVSGRLEISGLNSDYEGTKFRVRGNVRFDFPNLDRKWNAFIGRDEPNDFIRDRTEGLALRSQFLDFADENRWLAGLGYSLPGTYQQRTDFRVGGKLGSEPEIFVQGRHRRNWLINDRNLWHFRETVFWTNRDGFGSTTSLDFDHVVKRTMLLRWGNIGTISESTDGLEWRSAMLLYQSLNPVGRALAYEVFIRGESSHEVPLKEWGVRGVYRQPLMHRDWLAGEVVLGYSWPRFELEDDREGSLTVGLGLEILVGGWR